MAGTITSTDMSTLAGQSLLRHIHEKNIPAVVNLLEDEHIFLDERDEVSKLQKNIYKIR